MSSAAGVTYPGVGLSIAAATSDDALAREVERVCRARGYRFTRVRSASRVASAIASDHPDALLLDRRGSLDSAVRLARSLTSSHAGLPVVLIGEWHSRSLSGFRVVDRWRTGERILDQLELAYIGIPASVDDADLASAPSAPLPDQPA